jgi:hypothetical protein
MHLSLKVPGIPPLPHSPLLGKIYTQGRKPGCWRGQEAGSQERRAGGRWSRGSGGGGVGLVFCEVEVGGADGA